MKRMSFKLAFKHDYAREFGGKLGIRIYKHYRVKLAGKNSGAYLGVEPGDYGLRFRPEYGGLFDAFKTLLEAKQWLKGVLNG